MQLNPKTTAFTSLSISIIFSVLGQLLLKFGMIRGNQLEMNCSIIGYLIFFSNFHVLLGLSLYALGSLFWLFSLSKIDLSLAYPLTSVQYVLGFLGAWYFLAENINVIRVCGLVVICLGVGIMALEGVRHESSG